MTAPSPARGVRTWLIVSQVLYLLSLLPWLGMSGLAFMAFDAPGSTEMWGPWIFAGTIWAYPLLPLVCSIAAWIAYRRGRTRGAAVLTSVPMLLVVLGLGAIFVIGFLA